MERGQSTPPSSTLYGGERGAGGKFRKPPPRKPPATPYARPPTNQSQIAAAQPRDGGWLSKLVDPAYRFISGGATRILPSFFSRSPSTVAISSSDTEDHDEWETEVKKSGKDEDKNSTINLEISNSTGRAGPITSVDKGQHFDALGREKVSNLLEDNEFSKIEQLMKGKSFSRDDVNRLMEILNSRVLDLSDVDQQKKKSSMTAEGDALANENPRMCIEEKKDGLNRATWGSSIPLLNSTVIENPRMSVEEKQDGLNRAIWGTSTPHLKPTMRDDIGASPVDIARAYMGTRASEVRPGSSSTMSKDEAIVNQTDDFASMPFIPSPSPKPSTCWPGAIVQDHSGYSTPRSQRGKFGLHSFPRTPYSRAISLNSKSKPAQVQIVNNRSPSMSSTPLHQSQTPNFGQVKSRSDALNDGFGSVGPIRCIQHKFVPESQPRGSVSFRSSQNGIPPVENSKFSKDFWPAVKKNLEPAATSSSSEFELVDNTTRSSEVGARTPQASPSKAVRAILEHLDRTKPTPKQISAELKLATEWKKPKEHTSSMHVGGLDSHKKTDLARQQFSAQVNQDRGHSNFNLKPQERSSNEATNAVSKYREASNGIVVDNTLIRDSNAGPLVDLKRTVNSELNSGHEKATTEFAENKQKGPSQLWSLQNQINGQDVLKLVRTTSSSDLAKKPPFHSFSTKPILKSLSVNRSEPKRTFNPDNNSGFTFPVSAYSAYSGALSEPPTPSMTPSLSANSPSHPNEGPAVPLYTFGTKRSKPALVFSFPSTSSGSSHDEPSDLKFDFGSDKKARVSFRSVGKDSMCY